MLPGHLPDLVHVDALRFPADTVVEGIKFLSAEMELGPVAQMTAVVQRHAQKGVPTVQ